MNHKINFEKRPYNFKKLNGSFQKLYSFKLFDYYRNNSSPFAKWKLHETLRGYISDFNRIIRLF